MNNDANDGTARGPAEARRCGDRRFQASPPVVKSTNKIMTRPRKQRQTTMTRPSLAHSAREGAPNVARHALP